MQVPVEFPVAFDPLEIRKHVFPAPADGIAIAAQNAVSFVKVGWLPADVDLPVNGRTASEHVPLGDFGAASGKMLLRQ